MLPAHSDSRPAERTRTGADLAAQQRGLCGRAQIGRVKRSVSGPVAHGGEPDQRERQLAAQVALPTQRRRFASLSTSIDNARRCVAKIRRAGIA
jgi:hypothetical protein